MTETAKTWQKRVARWKAIKDSPLYQHMDAAQQKQFVQLLGDLGFSLDKHGIPPVRLYCCKRCTNPVFLGA